MKLYPNNEILVVQVFKLSKDDHSFYKVIILDESGNLFECFTDEESYKKLRVLCKDTPCPPLSSDFYFNVYHYRGELRIKLSS